MDVTAAFQGITTPIADLYNEIHTRGWQVTKLDIQDGNFVAEAKNPHGESVAKVGRDQASALGALLMFIVRREHIRQGAWSNHWADQLESIAQSYAKAPFFDPKAAAAWKELADDCVARANVLAQQLEIEITHDPTPYNTPQELWDDVHNNRHLIVSDAATEHPVWTRDQVVAFRIVHDVMGHAAAGGDFGWTGENLATAAHMPLLTPNAQRALFSETIGQAAYKQFYQGFGPQKICFLDDHLSPLQDSENPEAHAGEHPQMTLAPAGLPTREGGALRDPNYQYETGIVPPAMNAVTAWNDPLEHMKVKDLAHSLHTGWSQWKDEEGKPDQARMRVAIMNALRAALLSPMKQLKWNAVHYQDLEHVPYWTTDPKVYHDALENARIDHNRAKGFPDPEIRHKEHYEALLDFYRYYQAHNPELSPSEAKEAADREVQVMTAEIEEHLLDKAKDADAELFAPKVHKALDKRLKQIVKDDRPLYQASVSPNPYDEKREAYGAWINRHLIAISQLSKHVDLLLEAALNDVKRHDGSGHSWRSALLRLNIPYVGPKVASFAWLLLQPLTSQLATVDTHIADALGYKYKDVHSNRDYFRLERELMAGRDAAGYSHMPLGQFQWGLWDHKRTGPGSHQDHSPLRPWQPTPHYHVEWQPKGPPAESREWIAPEWWAATEPYRDQERARWDHDVAIKYPKNQIPWNEREVHVASAFSGPPAIVEHEGNYSQGIHDYSTRPWIFDSDTNTIHVGPHGGFHIDIQGVPITRTWLSGDHTGGRLHGPAFDDPHHDDLTDWKPDSFEVYHGHNKYLDHVRPALEQYYGVEYYGDNDDNWHTSSENKDEVHIALDVPEWVRKKISSFVGELHFEDEVDLLDPMEYHITVAYSVHGVKDLSIHTVKNSFNFTGMKFTGKRLTKFDDDALVVELESDSFADYANQLNDWLEDQGLEVSRYPGGPKPHITVAYTESGAPKAAVPPLLFRAGGLSFSTPRGADGIPPLYASHKFATTFECKRCKHNFGEQKPDHAYCPHCGKAMYGTTYNETTNQYELDWTKPTGFQVAVNSDQMGLDFPVELRVMPSNARDGFDPGYASRLTTGYDSNSKTLFIGPTGSYHQHCGSHFGVPMKEGEYDEGGTLNGPGWFVGYITLPKATTETTDLNQAKEQGLLKGAVMGWYHRTPDNTEELEQLAGVEPPEEGAEGAKTDDEMWEDADKEGLWDDENDQTDMPKQMGSLSVGTQIQVGKTSYKVIQNDGGTITIQHDKMPNITHTYPVAQLIPGFWKIISSEPEAKPEAKKPTTYSVLNVGDIVNNGPGNYLVTSKEDGKVTITFCGKGTTPKNPPSNWTYYDYEEIPSDWTITPASSVKKTVGDLPIGTVFTTGQGNQYKYLGESSKYPGTVDVQYLKEGNVPGQIFEGTFSLTDAVPETWKFEEEVPGLADIPPGPATHIGDLEIGDKLHSNYGSHFQVYNKTDSNVLFKDLELGDIYEYSHSTPIPTDWQHEPHGLVKGQQYTYHASPDPLTFSHVESIGPNKDIPMAILHSPKGDIWQAKPHMLKPVGSPEEKPKLPQQGVEPIEPQTKPSQTQHALFAFLENGEKQRVGDWTNWNDAIEQFDLHDSMHKSGEHGAPMTGSGAEGEELSPVKYFAVRSSDDPQWAEAPKTWLNWMPPQQGTFSRFFGRRRKKKKEHKPLQRAHYGYCTCTAGYPEHCPIHPHESASDEGESAVN